MADAVPPAYIGFLRIGAVVAAQVGIFLLVRRWPRLIRSLIAVGIVVGIGLLARVSMIGIWAEPGKIHYGSPGAELPFRIGLVLTVLGSAVFLVSLLKSPPRPTDGWVKPLIAELIVRLIVTYILGGIIGIIVFTVVTGYSK
jgi:hypothetical protein